MNKRLSNGIGTLRLLCFSIGAGIALAIPFLWYRLGWLVFVSVVPLLFLLKALDKYQINNRSKVGYIWMAGWTMLVVVLGWMLQTQPERWTAAQGSLAIGGLVFGYMAMSLCLSLGFVIFGCLYIWLKVRLNQKRVFLLLPAAWVMGEWLRSWLFSIISWGPNTTFGPHWNFGTLGFALSPTPLIFASRLVGLYGLTFIVILINLAVFWLLQKRWKLPVIVIIVIGFVSLVSWYIYRQPTGPSVNVATLQLGVNQDLKIGSIDYHSSLKSLGTPGSVDVLLLPEYSQIFQGEDSNATDVDAVQTLAKNNDTPVITSRQRTEDTKFYNTVTVYRPDSSIAYQHDKQFLIPVGEAMPYVFVYLFKLLGQSSLVNVSNSTREIIKGSEPARAYQLDGIKLGSMACSGAISPELYRSLVSDGAQILTNSASLSIFDHAPTYHQQAEQMARFMAVANARPYAQATDGSISYIIDSNGRWLARSSQDKIELLQKDVQTNKTKTLYSVIGEWTVFASIVILGIQVIVLYILPHYRKNHKNIVK